MQQLRNHTMRVGDHVIPVYIAGPARGPVFVLVHGIGVSHRYFVRFMHELAKTHQVIAFDMPGFGLASRPKKALTIHGLAQVVHGLLVQLNIEHPILVGHSMGCQVVADLLVHHPGATKKAILVGPTVDPRDRTRISHILRLLHDSLRETRAVNKIVMTDYIKCGPKHYLTTLNYMLADHIEDDLPKCKADVLVVRGARDPIVSQDWAEHAAKLAQGSYVEIAGAPHVVQHARAAELAMRFAEFADA
jgi:pimeloyl-ACP methyl ester carboxylesterase